MIEHLEISDDSNDPYCIGMCWSPDGKYLYDVRLMTFPEQPDERSGFTPLTGWYLESGKKYWFIKGLEATAEEVFNTLSDEEKEKAIWELNEWK